jgi:hypothetical protein
MTVIKLSGLPEEVQGRPLVVLDTWFVQTRYDRDSFAKIASRKRQLAFGVTLGLRGSALDLPYVKSVLDGEGTIAAIFPSSLTPPSKWQVTVYTDVLPPRTALYLEPNVPDDLGWMAKRLEELMNKVTEMRKRGLKIPSEMRAELKELEQIWELARIFRKPIGKPGCVKVTVPTPNGMSVLTFRVERPNRSLAKEIEGLHSYLYDFGVLKNPENAVRLRDAIVQARAEGSGEAQLRTRLIVRKARGRFIVEPYRELVVQEEKDVKEHLEFLNNLMGGSFVVEAAERKGKMGRGVVAFQGLLTIKAAFHPDAESRGHEQISIGEG